MMEGKGARQMDRIQRKLTLAALFLVCLLSACQMDTAIEKNPGKAIPAAGKVQGGEDGKKPIKIGFSMDTLLEERWLKDRDLFKEAIEELGAEVEIMAANGNDAVQISQAETLIKQRVDLLVVVPHNAEATASIVKKAHEAGIKVISYDRLVKNADIDLYISFDNEKVGELQAKSITKLVPKGKFVYIGGAITDHNAHLFKRGVFNVLQPLIDKGDIQIVYDQWSRDWTPANAFVNMEEALKANQNQIDAVIAANDATAGGAIQALAVQGMAGKIPVAGQDAELAGAQRIIRGTQTMTVYKPIGTLTKEAAELAVRIAKGEQVETTRKINNGKIEVPSVLLSPIAVDKHNMDSTIIADGFHSRDEVYK
ncbi:ribose ABC transporter substrate-binding protein [Cytobacillus firmus]|uniref:D-xylose ABC transporter substrate-binding protein n=1 Tax=Cytobacillus firmus TaxID=1399 RepID=UPI00077C483C|nr:ribose ABC transporter substrate-binding protein [Cytobacillus firmus]MBG9554987.1 ribose ABC transporter substrate-binding protein [Cytobacillus firmus]MBG9559433.1 ribose ABC transporter substrate-binding protein [Cytobacillus firmus]MBG9576821.1 ribose ABC transporter substrate-binding protein [Cytobacillus firmus]